MNGFVKFRIGYMLMVLSCCTLFLQAENFPQEKLLLDVNLKGDAVEYVRNLPVRPDKEGDAFLIDFDASRVTVPQRTFVLVCQVVNKDSVSDGALVRLFDPANAGSGVDYFRILSKNRILIQGVSSPEGEHVRRFVADLNMKNGKEIILIQTTDFQTRENHLIVDKDDYCFFSPQKQYSSENRALGGIKINSSQWLQVKRFAVYDRILKEEEVAALIGDQPDRHAASEMDTDQTSFQGFFLIHLALIGCVVWVYRTLKKERFQPITAEYVKSLSVGNNSESGRDVAWQYIEQARCPWKWSENEKKLTCFYPESWRELKNSRENLQLALKSGCTDADVLYALNELAAVHNQALKFTFNGWFPFIVIVLVAMLVMPLVQGEFWRTVLSWHYLGYWIALVAYGIVSVCPYGVACRGKEVSDPRALADRMSDWAADIAGGIIVGGTLAMGGVKHGLNFLNWCLENSISHFKVYRNGIHIGNTSEMNPTGLIVFALVIGGLIFLLFLAWTVVMFLLYFAAIYKFVRNYVLRK